MDIQIRKGPAQQIEDAIRRSKARTGSGDDGLEGGQGRHASALRDGYVQFTIAIVGIVCILVAAVVLAVTR